jgi:hypothetical protein
MVDQTAKIWGYESLNLTMQKQAQIIFLIFES